MPATLRIYWQEKFEPYLPRLRGDLPLLAVGHPNLGLDAVNFFEFVRHFFYVMSSPSRSESGGESREATWVCVVRKVNIRVVVLLGNLSCRVIVRVIDSVKSRVRSQSPVTCRGSDGSAPDWRGGAMRTVSTWLHAKSQRFRELLEKKRKCFNIRTYFLLNYCNTS